MALRRGPVETRPQYPKLTVIINNRAGLVLSQREAVTFEGNDTT